MYVFIVDLHHDIVECLNQAIRAKIIAYKESLLCIHFDAHADLSVPSIVDTDITMEDMNNPKKLVKLLDDSSGGIAEFLVPLLISNLLNKVVWIQPKYALKYGQGWSPSDVDYVFNVGDNKHKYNSNNDNDNDNDNRKELGVTLCNQYYIDDESICDEDDLINSKTLKINVSTINDFIESYTASNNDIHKTVNQDSWILDICLDYFTCHNPFLTEIRNHKVLSEHSNIDIENLITITRNIYLHLGHRNTKKIEFYQWTAKDIIEMKKKSDKFFYDLINLRVKEMDLENSDLLLDLVRELNMLIIGINQEKFKNGNEIEEDNNNYLLLEDEAKIEKMTKRFIIEILKIPQSLRKDLINLGSLLFLPEFEMNRDEMKQELENLQKLLEFLPRPRLVTIACSADNDEYTPINQVEWLLTEIRYMLIELSKGVWKKGEQNENEDHEKEKEVDGGDTNRNEKEEVKCFDVRKDRGVNLYQMLMNVTSSPAKRRWMESCGYT